jgi:hypothetical protein
MTSPFLEKVGPSTNRPGFDHSDQDELFPQVDTDHPRTKPVDQFLV